MRILTINVAQLPSLYNQMPNREARMNAVCDVLTTIPELSIVCFQELFSSDARDIALTRLLPRFPHVYMDNSCGAYLVGVNSGLTIFSEYALTAKTLVEYKDKRNVDIFAKKGVMGCECMLPPLLQLKTANLFVYSTHMQAGGNTFPFQYLNSKSANDIKYAQLRQAVAHIAQEVRNYPQAIVLLCGDLNLEPEDNPVAVIRERFPLAIDTFVQAQSPYLGTSSRGKRVDYVFLLQAPISVMAYSIIPMMFDTYTMTDHRAVLLNLH